MSEPGSKRLRQRAQSAFTLVELMAVMAIIGILTLGAVSTIQPVLESSSLTEGGQILVGQITLARQLASARNCTVQVRLIQTSATAKGYGAIQLWAAPSGGSLAPMSRLVALPQSVAISQDTTKLSPILTNASTGNQQFLGATVNYKAFSITPTGMVELSGGTADETAGQATTAATMASLYASVVPMRFAANVTPPANYVTVQMNPNTGAPIVFRP